MLNRIRLMTAEKKATLVQRANGERMIKISFPFSHDTLYKVRSLAGRVYVPDKQVWLAPVYPRSIRLLKEWGFVMDDRIDIQVKQEQTQLSKLAQTGIPGFKIIPFPYQYDGVSFIEKNNGRALIADEMGLGKTIEALAWIQLHRNRKPVIILVPASLKLNWLAEIEKCLPDPNVEILYGKKPWIPTGDIIIINYDILYKWVDVLRELNPQILIADECHYFKNNGTKRTKAVKRLVKNIPYRIPLSGTPIENRPVEGFNAFNMVNPGLFPNFMDFTRTYCVAKYNGYGWDFSGATNIKELHSILVDTIMIRRLKKDVLKDLPDKMYSFVPLELDNEIEYEYARDYFLEFIEEKKGIQAAISASNAEVLVQIETLKQLAVKGALKNSIDWIRNFLEVDGKLVVFAVHKFVINALMEEFGSIAVKIDGSCTNIQKENAKKEFQENPKIRLFVGNIKAGGVGITLTAASNVAFLELPWTPGALKQAIDRLHRFGQKFCVNVHYLFAVNTIMEKFAKLIDTKQKTIEAVMDGTEPETDTLLYELMKEFIKSNK
jgi:SWI/SNF-related matrix-associated actin-dependent regulator 1 of chromatin subfamily A